jgi:hypothetical protein
MSEPWYTASLETLVSKIEADLQELRKILQSRQKAAVELPPQDLQAFGPEEGTKEEMLESREILPGPTDSQSERAISPGEVEAIVQRVGKVYHDAEVLERLAKVERQNRKITLWGSIFLTILSLAVFGFAFSMVQLHLHGKVNLLPKAQEIASSKSAEPKKTDQQVSAPAAEAEAPGKYVGSITSNKYHYPDCKWAKTIPSRKLLTFKSVKEAREKGYIPCPVCKPPASDETQP